jgi:hypothetical protein
MHGGSPSEYDGAPGPFMVSETRHHRHHTGGVGGTAAGGQYMYCTAIIIIIVIINTTPCTKIQKCTIRELTIPNQKTT